MNFPVRNSCPGLLAIAVLFFCTAACSNETASAQPNGHADSGAPTAKRVGPANVSPVFIGDLKFEALQWGKDRGLGQNGGYIAALDAASGNELWTLKIYDVPYDPNLEGDVQDVFIKSMSKSLFGQKLNITDERGRKYVVDPKTRSVQAR
jgi:PQQ enzyme repeat